MLKTTICLIAVLMCIAFSEAQTDCPAIPCPMIQHPEDCRAITFFTNGNGVCRGCDKCMRKETNLDDNGCPTVACNRLPIPENCGLDMYYVYQNRVICQDCPRNKCDY